MQNIDPLVLDLVEWVAREPRKYADVLDTWRTSCPRLTVWEDAVDRAYVAHQRIEGLGACVVATDAGLAFLRARREVHVTLASCERPTTRLGGGTSGGTTGDSLSQAPRTSRHQCSHSIRAGRNCNP